MADFAVTFLLHYLPEVLKDLPQVVRRDENLLHELTEEVRALLGHLGRANTFLQEFEGRRNKHEKVKEVVNQIRDVAYEADDIIDQFIHDLQHGKRNRLARTVYRDHLRDVLQMAVMKIAATGTEINRIYGDGEKYGMESAEVTPSENLLIKATGRISGKGAWSGWSSLDEFGWDNRSAEVTPLVKQLVKGNPQLDVVSIVGAGGLGKTTLARKIYNEVDIKSHFTCRAWVCISRTFRIRELLIEILKYEMPKSDELTRKKQFKCFSEDELKRKLHECLQGRRYLIVMDDIDIWRTELWNEIGSVFPDNGKGSRILITSRTATVAALMTRTPPYLLPFLNEEESKELFRKKVFQGERCPPQLEDLGRRLANRCCGLPLSIVLLGGLLATQKKTQEAWFSLIGKVNWSLTEASAICKDIMALSYAELPRHLKPCFLYLCIYPENHEISVRQLINLWIAEGFIECSDVTEPEDVAEEYLKELIDRSLVEVASRRTDGGVKTCRIHGLLRDFCISESLEEKFLEVCKDVNHISGIKSRRLSIRGCIDPYLSSKLSYLPSPRSFLFFGQDEYNFDPSHRSLIHENLKLVRVLNFEKVDLSSIPASIGRLIHLRYLGMKPDAQKAIPASTCNLMNLQTLDLRGTFLSRLPKGMGKMRRLRNLYMSGPVRLPEDSEQDIGTLSSLRVLSSVYLDKQTFRVIGKLRNLKKLGIWLPSDKGHGLPVPFLLGLPVLPTPPVLPDLRRLKIIDGSLSLRLPYRIEKVTLRGVCSDSHGLNLLGKLGNLTVLKLQGCLLPTVVKVDCGLFPLLKVLKLDNLAIERFESLPGALPSLEHLVIRRCVELTRLDFGPETLTGLRNVEILWSPSELGRTLKKMQDKVEFNLLIYPPEGAEVTDKLW